MRYETVSVFDVHANYLVNPTNTVGAMGAGLAKEFRQRYPIMAELYKDACKQGRLRPGYLMIWHDPATQVHIINFPTKIHWSHPSRIEYIEAGLKTFVSIWNLQVPAIETVAFPQLGCGLGGLRWNEDVLPVFAKYLQPLPLDVVVCGV